MNECVLFQATLKANEEAMQQRVRNQARLQEETERQKNMEDDLRAQQQQEEKPAMEGDVYEALERLQRVEQQQREEIQR